MPKRKRSFSRFRRSFRRFSRSRYRYRRSSRFRRWTRKPRSLRGRVKALENNVEWKTADATQVLTSIPYNFTGANLLPRIDAGTGTGTLGDRIGDVITARFLQTRLTLDVGDTSNNVRVVIVKFPQVTGVVGAADVFQFPSTIIGDSRIPIQSLYKKDSVAKFSVLYDKVHYVNSTTAALKVLNIKVPLPKTGLKMYYPDSTSVQPTKNIINLYVCSDSSAVPHPGIVCNTRLTYCDS